VAVASNVVMTIQSIAERRKKVLGEWENFKDNTKARRVALENAMALQKFLQSADELEEWMLEKIGIADDASWREDDSTTFEVRCCPLSFHLPLRSIALLCHSCASQHEPTMPLWG
jgi:hypothetical protein